MVAASDAGQQEIAERVVRRALTLDKKECSARFSDTKQKGPARASNGLLPVYV